MVNGAWLYYVREGAGDPLLLIHAGVADSRMWDDQFAVFARRYQVICFDLRGFGRSDMPSGSFANFADVRALLDRLQIESAYILGLSFGSSIALDFALSYPERVKALILAAPSVSGSQPSTRIKQFWDAEDTLLAEGKLEEATELNLRLWVDGPQRRPEEVDPRVRERVRQMQMDTFRKEIPDDIEEIDLDPPAAVRLGELTMPVQVLVGELDLEEKVALARRLALEVPDGRLTIIPRAAHMLNMEQPQQFNEQVLNFLDPKI